MAIDQELPQDLLMEILSRLPVKSLLRLKSVSKYWFSLIQNPSFIHLHHNCSKKKDCLVLIRLRNDCDGDLILSSVPDKTLTHDLFESFEGLNLKDVNLIPSSNGLFFLAHFYKPKFVICNPAMKEFRILPDPFHHSRQTSHLGFVFDPNTKDYKVVRVATLYESDLTPYDAYDSPYVASDNDLLPEIPIDEKVHIYDLSTDCWREVDADVPKYFPSVSSHRFHNSLHGVFYWLYPCHYPIIIGFRMLDELFEEIPMPDISLLDCCPSTLCTLNDSLALVVGTCRITPMEPVETFFDFWVMEEHGIKESWTKKYTIGPFFGGYIYPLGFWKNGELLMNFDDNLVSYSVNSEKMKEYKIYSNPTSGQYESELEFFLYTECLISVKRCITQDIMGLSILNG